jgi:NAD(P)H dehydrogenase (quinone)
MRVLIVLAHPEPKSFNGALKDVAVNTLKAMGHEVKVSDLYAMKWRADLSADDFTGERADPDYLDLSREQEQMTASYGPRPEVKVEQDKVLWCDLLIFQFPMWWFGMPAILKGWCDRVMVRGFAYMRGRKYDSGIFKGRNAMICTTTGTAGSLYEPEGIDGALLHILWPVHNGIFRYLGFDVLPPHAVFAPLQATADDRQAMLDAYAAHLKRTESTDSLYFHPREDYDESQRLKPGVIARSGFQWNPDAGQSHDDAARDFTPTLES